MNVLVFTSNSLRHLSLLAKLERAGHRVWAYVEVPASGPRHTPAYWARVAKAEREVFPEAGWDNCRINVIPMGAASEHARIPDPVPERVVVFGSSYLRGVLADRLIELGAINLHAGVAPQYRGAACNFWAQYDGHWDLVGATIHLLGRGLDSGPILDTVTGSPFIDDPWLRSMQVLHTAQQILVADLPRRELHTTEQNGDELIRYSRAADFTPAVAEEFLHRYAPEVALHA